MSRYIEEDYLLELIKDENNERYGYIDAYDIKNAPTADVVPLDKVINVSLYDEEHEEWSNKEMTVRDYLYMYTDFEEEK